MFKRMGKSLSNLTSRQRGVGKEDRGETSLLGRPTEASPAARAAPPSPDAAIISTPQTVRHSSFAFARVFPVDGFSEQSNFDERPST
jgi:hypothetical protein